MRQLSSRHVLGQAAIVVACGLLCSSAQGATINWLASPADSSWANTANWQGGVAPGDLLGSSSVNVDIANFSSSSNLVVNPDAGRAVNRLTFSATAGNYTIGSTSGNALALSNYSTPTIQTANTATITINSPLILTKTSNQQVAAGGNLIFNGDITTPVTQVNFSMQSSSGTTTFNGSMSGAGRYYANSGLGLGRTILNNSNTNTGGLMMDQDKGTYELAHAGAITSAPITVQRGGNIVVSADNAITGSTTVGINDSTATYAASLTINNPNNYTGATTIGTFGTNAGVGARLLVNNASGSATGSGNVVINNGLLGGSGYIVNGSTYGVKLNKRTDGTGTVTYSKLSPGASAGAAGTLTMTLGSAGLDISNTVADASTQSMLFDLNTIVGSDRVNLLGTTVLKIGTGVLGFDDFAFTAGAGLENGVYTLFDSSSAISGSLGSNLTGSIGASGATGTLSIGDSGHDIVLTVAGVPEPASALLLCSSAVLLCVRRRRH